MNKMTRSYDVNVKPMVLVIHTIGYTGADSMAPYTHKHLMTIEEADNFIGFITRGKPFVKLNWDDINGRMANLKIPDNRVAYGVGRIITIRQEVCTSSGRRRICEQPQTIFLD